MAAAAKEFKCKKIFAKIKSRFIISGHEILFNNDKDIPKDFYITLAKKEEPEKSIAHINGKIVTLRSGQKILYIDTLHRYGFDGSNNSTKGAGLLLLDLVSCYAAKNNLTVILFAVPSSGRNNIKENNMRLYNFYEHAGLTAIGSEKKKNNTRKKIYRTKPNNLMRSLKSRYSGGGRKTRSWLR